MIVRIIVFGIGAVRCERRLFKEKKKKKKSVRFSVKLEFKPHAEVRP